MTYACLCVFDNVICLIVEVLCVESVKEQNMHGSFLNPRNSHGTTRKKLEDTDMSKESYLFLFFTNTHWEKLAVLTKRNLLKVVGLRAVPTNLAKKRVIKKSKQKER